MDVPFALFFLSYAVVINAGISIYPYGEEIPSNSTPVASATTPAAAGSTNTTSTQVHSTSTASSVESTTVNKEQEDDCTQQIGTIENGVPINTMRKYDVEMILEELGGAPGKVNISWREDVLSPPIEDLKERPLPDTKNETFWLYDYRKSDFKTYVRLEHALVRFKGTNEEFIDIRGELYWTPPDFCNQSRHAYYHKNDTGFHSKVSLEYCNIGSEQLWCAFPANCFVNATFQACVAAPSTALLASLVG